MFKHHKINETTSGRSADIEDLVTLNEMMKKIEGKETTYQQIKRKKACSSMRALADSRIKDDDDFANEQTLLDKGYEVDKIVGVTTMDNLGLLICYLIRYKGGQMELVPNKLVHQHCPQMVIEFLESRLVFQDQSDLFPINKTVDEIDSDEEMLAETSEHSDHQKNQDEEEQTLYVFDELSKYLNLNDFKNMIQTNDGGNYDDDDDDDGQALDKSSQINKLTAQEDIPMINSISEAAIDECESRNFENNHFNYISSLLDRKTNEDDYEPLLVDNQAQDENAELDADSDLQEINHTLSFQQYSSQDTIEDRPGSTVDHWTDLSEIPESPLSDTASIQQDVSLINESNQYSFEI